MSSELRAGTQAEPSFGERLSDGFNPILVKEVRQALRGRFFKISFWLTLTVATFVGLGVLLYMQAIGDAGLDEVYGPTFFIAMFSCLAVATQILVPFSAFLSMGVEWDENTFDLLVLSNLRPRQIVLGKVLSAAVQALLFYSAFGPFLVFSFLLRGVDLGTVAVALVVSMMGSVVFCCVAVAMSSFGQGRFARLILMVLLAVALVWSSTGTMVWASQLMFFPGQLHDPEYLQGVGAVISVGAAVAAFFFAAACARLAHPEENRSTGLRVMTVVAIAVGIAWVTLILGRAMDLEGVFATVCFAHAALGAGVLFYATEPERLGRRVEVTLPVQRWKRLLQLPFLPGGARGLVFFVLCSVLISAWALAYDVLADGMREFIGGKFLVFPALLGYGWLYLSIPSGIFSFHSDQFLSRVIARVVTLVSFAAAMLLPALVGFLFGINSWAEFEHPFNVFLSLAKLWEKGAPLPGTWPLLAIGGLAGVALNTPRLVRAIRELLRAGRA